MVFYPWRRFLARTLDHFIYNSIWGLFLIFVFHVNLTARSSFGNLFDSFMGLAIMLVLEPLWLHFFKTTPGKAVFGLRLEIFGGRRLSYSEGLERTWRVIGAGMGYNIPVYSLVRLWKSYKICAGNETQPWDESMSYTIKDTKWYRGILLVGAYAVILTVLTTAMLFQMLPPNRGDLTVSEFVENYNYYADYMGVDFGNMCLGENGKWAEKPFDGGVYIQVGYNEMPEYNYTINNGYVTGISFLVELRNNKEWIHSNNTQMAIASLSFAGAQKETVLFSKVPSRIAKQIQDNTFKSFTFIESGIEFTCDIEYSGYDYMSAGLLIPKDNAAEIFFKQQFSMNKLKQ